MLLSGAEQQKTPTHTFNTRQAAETIQMAAAHLEAVEHNCHLDMSICHSSVAPQCPKKYGKGDQMIHYGYCNYHVNSNPGSFVCAAA